MKKVYTLISLLFVLSLHAQNDIAGTWKQNALFRYEHRDVFELRPKNQNLKSGSSITFADGQFYTSYDNPPLGDDIRRYEYGRYNIDNDDYTTIYTDSIIYKGSGRKPASSYTSESVTYYTYRIPGGYKLIQTTGSITEDKTMAEDYDALQQFLRGYTEIGLKRQDWKRIKNAKTDDEIFKKGLPLVSGFDPAKAEILFIEDFNDNFYRLFLFQYEGKKYAFIYVDHHLGVCLYDESRNVVKFTN